MVLIIQPQYVAHIYMISAVMARIVWELRLLFELFQFYAECPNPTRAVVLPATHEIIIMSGACAISQIVCVYF